MTVLVAPTGPMCRVLRSIRIAPLLAVARSGRVTCWLGGCMIDLRIVAGLLARGLVEERATGDDRSEYVLTPAGRGWAEFRPQADPGGE